MNKPFPFLTDDSRYRRACDQILWQTEDFVVVPTVGALVPGWLLIVPKAPAICIGAVDSSLRAQLQEVKSRCIWTIQQRFGHAAVFEHGPATAGGAVGCTVDYAHLHVLPAPCELISSVADVCEAVPEWHCVDDIAATEVYFKRAVPYLYVEQPIGKAWIANAVGTPSQLFRRVIAKAIGRETEFNWREHPFHENAHATILLLSDSIGRSRQFATVPDFAAI